MKTGFAPTIKHNEDGEVYVEIDGVQSIIDLIDEKNDLHRGIENIFMFIYNAEHGVKADYIKCNHGISAMIMDKLYRNFELVKQFK